MARVILSGLVSDLRGSLGGVIAQRGPGGLSLRSPSLSSRPSTARQRAAAAYFGKASAAWRSLDAQARALWAAIARAYAPTPPGPGLASSLARQAFVRWYSAHLSTGHTPTRLVPLVYPFGSVGHVELLKLEPDPTPPAVIAELPALPVACSFWLRYAPNFPEWPRRGPWHLVYTSAEDPGLTWLNPSYYVAVLPLSRFLPLARYGLDTQWQLRVTLVLQGDIVARDDNGYAHITWSP